ncbi:acetyl-CoA carboxylase biotin carboxyl carrier protein [Sinorhizobium alkalisoli]|uniref:acetyl-CoA carboxylase biotin carboxyl carrier protein n=1 Tax=Sinorhizobium alkalisoli TaxID=1752398 RepID=UPI00124D6C74|nr:biotin/lipoyl-containing protein [Sinorhizobium alkalisoli]MCG5480677.1 biotin/lipoyl-binding protein [Sinorhizobium alkalisoli]QFI69418.1 Biotin carboxyl carrier protein of acetyl-CoA carboxylase [Sinorhizobium alkalisoli]
MDIEKLKTVMQWMAASPLVELELTEGDQHIKLVRAGGTPSRAMPPIRDPGTGSALTTPQPESVSRKFVDAPVFGIVHLSTSASEPAFVGVGRSVKSGDTLCLIEAMKVFTTIEAPCDGVISDILVKAGGEVAMGQPLFLIESEAQ